MERFQRRFICPMTNFKSAIQAHETHLNEMHARVHETFKQRDQSRWKYDEWTNAARRFREARSEIDEMCDSCISDGLKVYPMLRRFAFEYLSVDPYYFRSGYFVEKLLRRVKKLKLTDGEKHILQELVLRRIRARALRNFRHICRLIHLIETKEFLAEVSFLARSDNPNVRRRAEFALQYFPHDGKSRGVDFIKM